MAPPTIQLSINSVNRPSTNAQCLIQDMPLRELPPLIKSCPPPSRPGGKIHAFTFHSVCYYTTEKTPAQNAMRQFPMLFFMFYTTAVVVLGFLCDVNQITQTPMKVHKMPLILNVRGIPHLLVKSWLRHCMSQQK